MDPRPEPDPDTSPIFVVGASRSGTTLLRMMLSAHPRIHLTMEASFYLWGALYPRWRDPDGFPPFYLRSFSFRWLRLDPAEVIRDLPRPFRREDRKQLYTAVMRAQAGRHGKVRFGDKTPGHSSHLAQLFADWPDARVVRMVRDPREVIGSLVRMPWASPSLCLAAAMTDWERRQVAPFRDRILEVRLTDLLGSPRETMGRVLDHVGERWDDRVLDHAPHAPDDLPPMPWFRSAGGERVAPAGPESPAPGPLGPRAVDAVEVRLLERLSRTALRELGLPPVPVAEEPGLLAVVGRYLRDLPVAARGAWLGLKLLRASLRGDDPQRTAQLLLELNPRAWAAAGDFRMPAPPDLPQGWEEAWATCPTPAGTPRPPPPGTPRTSAPSPPPPSPGPRS